MKIPQSIRNKYEEIYPRYIELGKGVTNLIGAVKSKHWHYESRVKELESYALKLETGRELHPSSPEDMFACTLVVENYSRIPAAEREICNLFKLESRRPKKQKRTTLFPQDFSFDDLRLYMSWIDDDRLPPTGLHGLLFEVQIKTFLQHAWGIATHDLIYKADEVNWGASRVAFQVKAMLENAELSISEAKRLTASSLLDRTNQHTDDITLVVSELKARWPDPGTLPKDVQRLAQNVIHLSQCLKVGLPVIWQALDEATQKGQGAKQLNLSPYSAILESLISKRGAPLFGPLGDPNNKRNLFIPLEVELPPLAASIKKFLIQPK